MEPPSPTSSTSSSRSSPFGGFSALPITGLRQKIVEKILENRVTLIVGETGCGKSSQVPQFLLDANIKPILCTQPRRFAVVAVAKMVANSRNCVLGEEIGYHIGHSKNLSPSSKIVFKTAGVLLDEMREKGMNALNYKAIILDEVHERSVESDLVLVCIKQFLLKNNNLRVVLMSATADIGRYKEYFGDIGRDERVEVLGIPSSDQHSFFERKVLYLEQVASFLGRSLDSLSTDCCPGEGPSKALAAIKPEMHKLIHDLIIKIHYNEAEIEKGILVFLPTYRSLEQQWFLLKPFSSIFKVHILHSSIDTNQALDAMKIWKSHRKIILATNIAESSVTIPNVAYVIDSCRSLEVFWDSEKKAESSELVWISKSQAEQRRGRTGRTCDGLIYRFVTGSFFNKLQDHERPSILRLSLRQQVLNVCCAESKAINDPKVLLQKALDPPEADVIEDALRLLVQMGALEKVSYRRYEPTYYGRLLSSFPLGFDACVLILKFGSAGMLHEGILLGILMDMQPLPILHPFGEEPLFREYIESYYRGSTSNSNPLGQSEMIYMGNLCAFKFWQRVFKDKHRIGHLEGVLKSEANEGQDPKIEAEWCSFHNLLQSSLHQASEIYGDALSSLHRFRPYFLGPTDGFPSYYYPYEFKHTCTIKSQSLEETEAVAADDDKVRPSSDMKKCVVGPFIPPDQDHFQTSLVASELAVIVKEMRSLYLGVQPGTQPGNVTENNSNVVYGEAPSCVYFLKGACTRGSTCAFAHSVQAKQPSCKFFFSLKGCRNGNACPFSHDMGPASPSSQPASVCVPEEDSANPMSLLQLFPTSPDDSILILDDTDLQFTSNIATFLDPSQIVATTSLSELNIFEPKLSDVRILWGLNHPYQPMICKTAGSLVPWREITCILWFPSLESSGPELLDAKETTHFRTFFEYLSIRIIADGLHRVRLVLTMNNIRFSQLQVEKIARESFFFITESFPFDDTSFGEISCNVATRKAGWVSRPISYLFDLHPPSDVQFGNYGADIQNSLMDVHQLYS